MAYAVAVGLLGVLAAAVFDPVAQGCVDCPANLLRVATDPGVHADVQRSGVRLAGVVYAGTALLLVWSLSLRRSRAGGRSRPCYCPVTGYLAFAAAAYWARVGSRLLSNDPTDRALWLGQAACLAGDRRGGRVGASPRPVARVRHSPGSSSTSPTSPRPGRLRGLLAITLGDPGLQIVYPAQGGGWIDSGGRPVPALRAAGDPGRRR